MKQISKQEIINLISKICKVNKSKIDINSSIKNIDEWDQLII